MARGALLAARVNALVKERSSGKHSLDTIVLALLGQARTTGKALALSEWHKTLAVELGEEQAVALDRLLLQGGDIELPEHALGPCLRQAPERQAVFGLGFDLAATRASDSKELVGLDPRGPAAHAGARKGDALEEIEHENKRPDVPVKLVLSRAKTKVTLRYAPVIATVPFSGWERVAGVHDEACQR